MLRSFCLTFIITIRNTLKDCPSSNGNNAESTPPRRRKRPSQSTARATARNRTTRSSRRASMDIGTTDPEEQE
jgi:hypothetical protein